MRVRFAPSPTGYFHVGGARTAFYNWLLARQNGGSFVLRIEDTDAERNREEWVDGICDALTWLGITWDEGPIRQSDRTSLYQNAARDLFDRGLAYYCICTRAEIDLRNSENATKPGYDRHCRQSGLGPDSGGALRFKVPLPGETHFVDLVRGDVTFDHANIEDFILVKSSGAPLFVLANVVDDIDMRITHVIRAEEHLPNTPKAHLLFQALNATVPTFGHVPVLVNEKRQKLSKRRDKVAVEDYRKQGYIAPAMLNYLALLGWSPKDDREFMSVDEMIDLFDMNNVGHSPSFFDEKKLAHFNGVYIRALDIDEFFRLCLPFVADMSWWITSDSNIEMLKLALPLAKERVALLSEVSELVRPLFEDDLTFDSDAVEKDLFNNQRAVEILDLALAGLTALADFTPTSIAELLRGISAEIEVPLRKLQAPIRVAVTGSKVGLPLFELISFIGRDVVIRRLSSASYLVGKS